MTFIPRTPFLTINLPSPQILSYQEIETKVMFFTFLCLLFNDYEEYFAFWTKQLSVCASGWICIFKNMDYHISNIISWYISILTLEIIMLAHNNNFINMLYMFVPRYNQNWFTSNVYVSLSLLSIKVLNFNFYIYYKVHDNSSDQSITVMFLDITVIHSSFFLPCLSTTKRLHITA